MYPNVLLVAGRAFGEPVAPVEISQHLSGIVSSSCPQLFDFDFECLTCAEGKQWQREC